MYAFFLQTQNLTFISELEFASYMPHL